MQVVSNEYKNLLNTSLSFTPKSKVIVDDVEYLGDVIKTSPIISHSNSSFIGGFPIKTCSFEIYDFNSDLDFEGKEVTVYKGIEVNNVIEWICLGIFIPQAKDITNNISAKTITIHNAQDKAQLFDTQYASSLSWENDTKHTGLEIVQEICSSLNIALESTSFGWANYEFSQPNFPSGITNREVISRLAEIGGEIALISPSGGLLLKGQYNTGDAITNRRYSKLTKEKEHIVNTLVLGKKGIDDDIVYPISIDTERVEHRIEDNPFVDLYREDMIEEVSSYIIGMSYTPFSISEFIDGFIYELNDVINITDKNGNSFDAVILDYSTTARIKSNIKAGNVGENITNYAIAGSMQDSINKVKLEVNHISGEITSLTTKVENIEVGTGYATIESVNQLIQNANDGLVNTMSKKGGNNLLFNTYFSEYDENGQLTFWEGSQSVVNNSESKTNNALSLQEGSIKQTISLINRDYCFSFKYKKLIEVANCQVKINGKTFDISAAEINVENYVENVENLTSNSFIVEFICDTNDGFLIYEPMLNEGSTASQFTQNANETVTDTVVIGKGIEVNASNIATKTRLDADGLRGKNINNNEVVFYQTDEGLYGKKLETESIKSGDLIISTKSGHNFFVGL